jgi:hypothetical protein
MINATMTFLLSYIGAEFPQIIAKPEVEYRQANLTVPCAYLPVSSRYISDLILNKLPWRLPSILLKGKLLMIMSLISRARLGMIARKWWASLFTLCSS